MKWFNDLTICMIKWFNDLTICMIKWFNDLCDLEMPFVEEIKRIIETFVEGDLVEKSLFLFMVMMACLALSGTMAIFSLVITMIRGC